MKKLNYMKSSTAVMIVVLLHTACLWNSWQVRLAEVAAMQADGVARLQAMIDPELYRNAEQKEISRILGDTEASIRESDDQHEIDSMLNAAYTQFSTLKTDAAYTRFEKEAARLAERERKRQEELERQRLEEEARRAAEAAARARQKSKSSSSNRSSSSNGCVGTSSDVFW